MILVFVESPGDELSHQALAFAREHDEEIEAVLIGAERSQAAALGALGVARAHLVADPSLAAYAPQAWGRALAALCTQRSPRALVGPGSERGNEVLAHAAAILDLPLSANTTSLAIGETPEVVRVRWGGSLLEEARVHGRPALLSVAPHAVMAASPDGGEAEVLQANVSPAAEDLRAQVRERIRAQSEGVSLADAEVVVGGGRGVGSPEGFALLEELAGLLGAAVGCSRAVTMAGWRPHTDQIGQTGTKISPELYIACGISGATQHMAGCRGAKRLLAVNPDAEASILASADYAVIGDLHEVIPAVCEEIRRRRSG
jgi:electron transfer flavoprotein alpha subunit